MARLILVAVHNNRFNIDRDAPPRPRVIHDFSARAPRAISRIITTRPRFEIKKKKKEKKITIGAAASRRNDIRLGNILARHEGKGGRREWTDRRDTRGLLDLSDVVNPALNAILTNRIKRKTRLLYRVATF